MYCTMYNHNDYEMLTVINRRTLNNNNRNLFITNTKHQLGDKKTDKFVSISCNYSLF